MKGEERALLFDGCERCPKCTARIPGNLLGCPECCGSKIEAPPTERKLKAGAEPEQTSFLDAEYPA